MSLQVSRARSVPELVDGAFSLYRRDAASYIMVTAIAVTPGLIAQLLFLRPSTPPGSSATMASLLVALITIVSYSLMTGVITKMGADVFLGGDADVAGAVRAALPKTGTLVAVGMMQGILYFLYALLLVFPILIAFAKYFAPQAAVMLEDKSSGDAIARSASLSDGHRWHVLKTMGLGYLIYFLLFLALGFLGLVDDTQVVSLVVQTAVTVVAYPIIGLLALLLYYDLRIRKEGFDLEHLSQQLGDLPPRGSR